MRAATPDTTELFVDSETGTLREVVLGLGAGFHSVAPEITNTTMPRFYEEDDRPTASGLEAQLEAFRVELARAGAVVHRPEQLDGVPDQVCPRDLGFVVGDRFFWCRMKHQSRRAEQGGINGIVEGFDPERVRTPPGGCVLEGGDVRVDPEAGFVGVGQRPDRAGVEWLADELRGFRDVVPGELSGDEVLHLDCAFSPVGQRTALVFPEGFTGGLPEAIRERYDNLIEVTREEQANLATNVLSLDPHTVVSRADSTRVNAELRALGFDVREVDFTEAPKTGGSFRCTTLVLRRDALD